MVFTGDRQKLYAIITAIKWLILGLLGRWMVRHLIAFDTKLCEIVNIKLCSESTIKVTGYIFYIREVVT